MKNIVPAPIRYEPGAPVPAGSIPLCIPEIRGNEWKYVKDCLDTAMVSSVGSYVSRFEDAIAGYVGRKHAIATVNGTAALHIALLMAGVEANDEVLVSTLTFISPANAIRYVGAWPVYIDAEPEYMQIDSKKVIEFIEKGCKFENGTLYDRKTGRRVKAILPVHILGHPVDIDPILEVAKKYGLVVIEDATESLGARYKGKMVGKLGDISCFSFNGNKLITTGGGGMITTDDDSFAARARYLTTQAKDDPIEYVHNEIGYNYRLTNIQAAVGVAQMERINEYIAAKRRIAESYARSLSEIRGIRPMHEASWAFSVFWMYTVLVDMIEYGRDSRQLLKYLGFYNIQTRPLWQPIHTSRAHADNIVIRDCPVAEILNRNALSLPCSVGLKDEDQNIVIKNIINGYKK